MTATNADGEVAASVRTEDDGTFELQLTSGTYTITGRSERYVNGDVDCVTTAPTGVADIDIDGVVVGCSMR